MEWAGEGEEGVKPCGIQVLASLSAGVLAFRIDLHAVTVVCLCIPTASTLPGPLSTLQKYLPKGRRTEERKQKDGALPLESSGPSE